MGSQGGLGGLLEASWRPLGAPKASLSAKEGIPGANAALLGPKKVVLTASWPLQGHFQERFQPTWRPKGPKREAKRVQNRVQKVTQAENVNSCKTIFL